MTASKAAGNCTFHWLSTALLAARALQLVASVHDFTTRPCVCLLAQHRRVQVDKSELEKLKKKERKKRREGR
jgi:hypothetical protein